MAGFKMFIANSPVSLRNHEHQKHDAVYNINLCMEFKGNRHINETMLHT
jgi:hypothetical protein